MQHIFYTKCTLEIKSYNFKLQDLHMYVQLYRKELIYCKIFIAAILSQVKVYFSLLKIFLSGGIYFLFLVIAFLLLAADGYSCCAMHQLPYSAKRWWGKTLVNW